MTIKEDLQNALKNAEDAALSAKEIYALAKESERKADGALASFLAKENWNLELGDIVVFGKGKGEGRVRAEALRLAYDNEKIEVVGRAILKSGALGGNTLNISVGGNYGWHCFIRVEKAEAAEKAGAA